MQGPVRRKEDSAACVPITTAACQQLPQLALQFVNQRPKKHSPKACTRGELISENMKCKKSSDGEQERHGGERTIAKAPGARIHLLWDSELDSKWTKPTNRLC